MATWMCWRLWFVITFVCCCDARLLTYTSPNVESVSILSDMSKIRDKLPVRELLVELRGRNFASALEIKLTESESECNDDSINCTVKQTWIHPPNVAQFVVTFPFDIKPRNLYFCARYGPQMTVNFGGEVIKWNHAGRSVFIKSGPRTTENITVHFHQDFRNETRARRSYSTGEEETPLRVSGLRIEYSDKEPDQRDDGVPVLLADTSATLLLFGDGLTEDTCITFTHLAGQYGGACQLPATDFYQVKKKLEDETDKIARVTVRLPASQTDESFYICAKRQSPCTSNISSVAAAVPFVHQGAENWLQLRSYKKLLPIWASIIIIISCLSFSALFSGLNLGLMSLDRTELKILCNTGNETERKYARIIKPVRDHGNYLLCSILLGNVLVNSTFTILLDDLTSGLIAVLFSTLAIVMFGEISPQAVCSRHGLAVGARTILITKAVMFITFPLSYPISKILDCLLGEEIGNVYNRERLKELVKVTTDINDLDRDEVNIISGALELRKKTVCDVMTRIEDVFMLDYEAILDFETVSEIMKSGFSRIPVFEGNRTNIVTVLYIKDLAFVDPDDNTPLKTLCQFYQNPCNFVFEDQTLDVMFRQFKEGNKGHMAFVHRVNNEGEGDPFYETIGLVTLEDVIEELIQAEIMDETDVFTDNRSKRKRENKTKQKDFSVFAQPRENQRNHISPQMALATYQYLSTSLDQFKPDIISETTLRRLLKQDIFQLIKKNKKSEKEDDSTYIYQQGKPADYFVLILEGRVEVTVGRENLVFDAGPFTYFGAQALMQNISVAESPVVASQVGSLQSLNMDAMLRHTFQPDYSVKAVVDVLYMRVSRSLYLAAKRATLMERSQLDQSDDVEVEQLLCSLDDGESIGRISPKRIAENHEAARSPLHRGTSPTSDSTRDVNGSVNFPHADADDEEVISLLRKTTEKL